MLQNWNFLLGEIWGLLALAALLGLFAGWLIWNRTSELRALRNDLDARSRELKTAETRAEAVALEYETSKTEFENERLGLLQAREAAEAERDQQGTRLAALSDDLEKTRAREQSLIKVKDERDAIAIAKGKAQSQHADEIARVRRRDEVITSMKTELHSAKTEAQRASTLQAELKAAEAKGHRLDELEAELTAMRQKAEQAETTAAELARMRTKAARADELETELASVRARAGKAEQLERDLSAANTKAASVAGYISQVETRDRRITELERDLASAKAGGSDTDQLGREIEGLRRDVKSRDATIAELRARNSTTHVISQASDVPANAARAIPDYDGDGKHEGRNEGRKPETLQFARGGRADDLKRIKGVGPKLEAMLNDLGFFHYDQVGAWSADEVAWVDANLEGFNGRVSRDNWIEQARILAAGGSTEFASRVDDGSVYED
jgi:predicted flap endonuclease-1-like 5' DNA nuclease